MAITTSPVNQSQHQVFQDGFTSEALNNVSVKSGLVALAGGGQTGATPLEASVNIVATCATNADSAILPVPPAVAGTQVWVKNSGAATLAVFPHVGGNVNGGSTNASVNVAANAKQLFVAVSGSRWETLV